ncbi:MAG: 6-phosphogluconolactonase [bacterium]|nr:6-phosphogluconolactonase [bacterium]
MSDENSQAQPETTAQPDGKAAVAVATEKADTRPWAPSAAQVLRFADAEEVAEAAAKKVAETVKKAVEKNERCIVALAGGNTPRRLYEKLAAEPYRDEVPWTKTYFVFGDERCVAPDDEASNHRMAQELLFTPLEIPAHRVLRMKGEQVPADAARRYEVRLKDLFLNQPKRHFDLVLLGVGADGHTASLFPGTAALAEEEKWVAANEVPQLEAWRLTLTLPALNSARRVILLATGEEKARVIAEAFCGVKHDEPYPCERVAPYHAKREVLVDAAAASQIPPKK